jgi:hypothetical protein
MDSNLKSNPYIKTKINRQIIDNTKKIIQKNKARETNIEIGNINREISQRLLEKLILPKRIYKCLKK